MKNSKILTTYGAAFLMAVSMGSVYAEEGDMARLQSHTQTGTGITSQSKYGEQKQYRNTYRKKYQTQQPNVSPGSKNRGAMSRQSSAGRSMGGGRR